MHTNIDFLWFYFQLCLSIFDIIWGYCRQLSLSHPFSGCSLSQWLPQTILNQQLDSGYILIVPQSRKRTIDLIFVDSLGEAVITYFLLWHIWQEFANIKPFFCLSSDANQYHSMVLHLPVYETQRPQDIINKSEHFTVLFIIYIKLKASAREQSAIKTFLYRLSYSDINAYECRTPGFTFGTLHYFVCFVEIRENDWSCPVVACVFLIN